MEVSPKILQGGQVESLDPEVRHFLADGIDEPAHSLSSWWSANFAFSMWLDRLLWSVQR